MFGNDYRHLAEHTCVKYSRYSNNH